MARIGEIGCCNPACGCTDVAVHRTAGGKLSARCHKCASERWAPVGTKAHRDMTAQTAMDEDHEAKPEEKAPPVAAAKPKARGFELGAL
jgi:hypothetical protein